MIMYAHKINRLIAIIVFYNESYGIQSCLAFSKEFKHCQSIIYDGRDYVLIDMDETGIITRTIHATSASRLIQSLIHLPSVSAIMALDIYDRHHFPWRPWWVRSCNELCRYHASIDIGFTFNPSHLYHKLIKYNQLRNYDVIAHWRRSTHGVSTSASKAIGSRPTAK